jgi:hypothetical protein
MLKFIVGLLLTVYGLLDMTLGFTGIDWLAWVCVGAGLVLCGRLLLVGAFKFLGFVIMVWIALLVLNALGLF